MDTADKIELTVGIVTVIAGAFAMTDIWSAFIGGCMVAGGMLIASALQGRR